MQGKVGLCWHVKRRNTLQTSDLASGSKWLVGDEPSNSPDTWNTRPIWCYTHSQENHDKDHKFRTGKNRTEMGSHAQVPRMYIVRQLPSESMVSLIYYLNTNLQPIVKIWEDLRSIWEEFEKKEERRRSRVRERKRDGGSGVPIARSRFDLFNGSSLLPKSGHSPSLVHVIECLAHIQIFQARCTNNPIGVNWQEC